ncbi:MAG TPA: hypothetical protein VJN02_04310 [Gammaproteobacteria bacterium]|nr:hypothetical protein [Gammaproteobacteria bacterium]
MDTRSLSKNNLIELLQQNFPIDYNLRNFYLYPFCNEYDFPKILDKLATTVAKQTDMLRVAILFGESNFLSILPELSIHADVILLADIEPLMHKHTSHLLNCLNIANSREEFTNYYSINNPIEHYTNVTRTGISCGKTLDDLLKNIYHHQDLGNYHFYDNQKRFNECKKSLKNLIISQINLNLFDEIKCNQLSSLLRKNNATISLCNFSNIHELDPDESKFIKSTSTLLHGIKDCFIMYTSRNWNPNRGALLGTNLITGLNDFYRTALKNEKIKFDRKVTSIQFWYRRVRDENLALKSIPDIKKSILAKNIWARRGKLEQQVRPDPIG